MVEHKGAMPARRNAIGIVCAFVVLFVAFICQSSFQGTDVIAVINEVIALLPTLLAGQIPSTGATVWSMPSVWHRLMQDLGLISKSEIWRADPRFQAVPCGDGKPVRVAILGGGIAGLMTAYNLEESNRYRGCSDSRRGEMPKNEAPEFDVTLFEATPRLGGHSWTVKFPSGSVDAYPEGYPVDVAYNYNPAIHDYEAIRRFQRKHGINMKGPLQQNIRVFKENFTGFSDQQKHEFDSECDRFMQLVRFAQSHPRTHGILHGLVTFRGFLKAHGFSEEFFLYRLYPIIRFIIVSGQKSKMLDAPAFASLQIYRAEWATCYAAGMHGSQDWYSVRGGSERHIDVIKEKLGDRLHVNSPVSSVRVEEDGVFIRINGGEEQLFDAVVVSTPPDVAREILGAQAPDWMRFVTTEPITLALHSDESVLGPAANEIVDGKETNLVYVGAPESGNYGIAGLSVRWDSIFGEKLQQPRPILTYAPEVFTGGSSKLKGEVWRAKLNHLHYPQLDTALRAEKDISETHNAPKTRLFYAGSWVSWTFSHPGGMKRAWDVSYSLGARPQEHFLWDSRYADQDGWKARMKASGGMHDPLMS